MYAFFNVDLSGGGERVRDQSPPSNAIRTPENTILYHILFKKQGNIGCRVFLPPGVCGGYHTILVPPLVRGCMDKMKIREQEIEVKMTTTGEKNDIQNGGEI